MKSTVGTWGARHRVSGLVQRGANLRRSGEAAEGTQQPGVARRLGVRLSAELDVIGAITAEILIIRRLQ